MSSIRKFKKRLKQLGFASYRDYLNSELWKNNRRRFLESGFFNGKCKICHCRSSRIEIHHRSYKRIGQEMLIDMIGVCPECHEAIHDIHTATGFDLWLSTRIVCRGVEKQLQRNGYRDLKRTASSALADLVSRAYSGGLKRKEVGGKKLPKAFRGDSSSGRCPKEIRRARRKGLLVHRHLNWVIGQYGSDPTPHHFSTYVGVFPGRKTTGRDNASPLVEPQPRQGMQLRTGAPLPSNTTGGPEAMSSLQTLSGVSER